MRRAGSRRELPRCLGAALLAALQILDESEQQVPNGECCAVGYRLARQLLLEVLLGAPSQSCSAGLSDSQLVIHNSQMPAPDSSSHILDVCSPTNDHVQWATHHPLWEHLLRCLRRRTMPPACVAHGSAADAMQQPVHLISLPKHLAASRCCTWGGSQLHPAAHGRCPSGSLADRSCCMQVWLMDSCA